MGCMADAVGGQLDTCIEIVTPENIAFQYRVAGPFRRLPAFLIDLAIRIGLVAAGFIVALLTFGSIGATGLGLGGGMVIWFVLAWFYGGLFEALWNGQTPGKRLMGIRVVAIEGQPITPFQAILRNILRAVDAQPVGCYLVGLVAATLNDRFQRLGDLPAGTMVVVEERRFLPGWCGFTSRRRSARPPRFRRRSAPAAPWAACWPPTSSGGNCFPGAGGSRSPGISASRCGSTFSFPPAPISTCCFAGCIAGPSSPIAPKSRRKAIRRSADR